MKKYISHSILMLLLLVMHMQVKAQNAEDGIGFSHAGKYDEAEKIFSKLIIADGKNIRLLIASGFNNAWNKKYAAARSRFRQALQLEPANEEAAKGLAYTYLYKGEYTKAAHAFNKLSTAHFNTDEYHFALGLAYMNLQKKNKAYLQFEKVLELNKANTEAKKISDEIRSGKRILDLSALGGLTSYTGESKLGLRQIQVGYHVNNEVFVYARYDNSLARDNYFFLKNNFNSNAFIGGVYSRWHYRVGSKFEYGYRTMPGKMQQNIFQTEQVIFLPKNFSFKFGGSVISTTNQPQKEWMLMGSISVPAGNKIKIEPHYYLIHRFADEHRLLLNVSYNFSAKTDIAVGVFNGSEKNIKTNIKTTVFGAYAYSNFLITGPLTGIILTRYEKDAFGGNSFIAAAGLKIAIDTKKF